MKASSSKLLIDLDDRGSKSPLKCVEECVENRFGGAACSISVVNGDEFNWSTFLRRASSKSPLIYKS
ncbi:unnamed protein product [Prunus brigantina]